MDMMNWKGFLVGVGIGAGVFAAATSVWYFLGKKKKHHAPNGNNGYNERIQIVPPVMAPRFNVIEMMDECLLESMEFLTRVSSMNKDISIYAEEISSQVNKILDKMEEAVCFRHHVDIAEYYREKEILEKEKNKEIIQRLNGRKEILKDILDGKKPKVDFPISPDLTQETAFTLLRRILISHLFLQHQEIQELVKNNPEATLMEITNLLEKLELRKDERKDKIMEKYNIKKSPSQEYDRLFRQAYYTYYSKFHSFALQCDTLLKMQEILKKKILSKETIPEFTQDPLEMNEKEFEEFYQNLVNVYCKTDPSILPSAAHPA